MKKQIQDADPSRLLRCRDSIYASDLLVCAVAWFDFFTVLKEKPGTFNEICDTIKVLPRPADVLLSLLLSMDLVEACGQAFGLTELSEKYLVSDSPDSLVPYYSSLKNRPQCIEFRNVLQTGKPAGWSSRDKGESWIKSMRNQEFADSFTAAMDSRGAFLARKLAETLDVSQNRALLDVAGGSGIYACTIAGRNSHLAAAVLEIPPVDLAATRSVASKRMSSRVKVVSGNMFEAIPAGYDVHLFANAFHDWDIDFVSTLAANSFKSLSPGGF